MQGPQTRSVGGGAASWIPSSALLILSFAVLLGGTAGCAVRSNATAGASTYFETPDEIALDLLDPSDASRVEAVELLLHGLGTFGNVDTSRASRYGVVTVAVTLGVRKEHWQVPFHLVWHQGSDSLSLLAWSANSRADLTMGDLARSKAIDVLTTHIELATDGSEDLLHGRIQLASPFS